MPTSIDIWQIELLRPELDEWREALRVRVTELCRRDNKPLEVAQQMFKDQVRSGEHSWDLFVDNAAITRSYSISNNHNRSLSGYWTTCSSRTNASRGERRHRSLAKYRCGSSC